MVKINNISSFILVLLLACFATSCKLQPLYDINTGNVLVPVELDWSETDLESTDFSGASVWLFPKSTSTRATTPIECKLTDYTGGYIYVAPGDYDVLMFNKTVTELEALGNVGFRGKHSFETFEYYKKEATPTLYKDYGGSYSTATYYKSPDKLAVESRTLSVTQEMSSYNEIVVAARSSRSSVMDGADSRSLETKYNTLYAGLPDAMLVLVGVKPVDVVNTKRVSAYVENGNNAKAAEVLLTSSPTSVFLHNRSKSSSYGSVLSTITDKPTYEEGDTTNATFEARFRHFGSVVSGSSRNTAADSKVELLFQLATNFENGDLYPLINDGPFNKAVSGADMDKIYNEVIIEKAPEGVDNEFILPEIDMDEGGFKPGVGGWPDDDIIVPLG